MKIAGWLSRLSIHRKVISQTKGAPPPRSTPRFAYEITRMGSGTNGACISSSNYGKQSVVHINQDGEGKN